MSGNATIESCRSVLVALGYTVTEPDDAPLRRSLCEGLRGLYSVGWHVGGLFVVLFASLGGVILPFLTKYIDSLKSNPYAFTVGKTAATGVLLSVSTIHLINEGIAAFNEPCIPHWLQVYEAYAFLFALVAVLLMQALDIELANIAEGWVRKKNARQREAKDVVITNEETTPEAAHGQARESESARMSDIASEELLAMGDASPTKALPSPAPESPVKHFTQDGDQTSRAADQDKDSHVHDEEECHGHQHFLVTPPDELGAIKHVIAAICMEFGVTLHSVFVGIAVGLTTDQELKPLLVALFFHQLFEGMAMGSRIVDASFHGKLEIALALLFSFSAPLGMALAIIVVSISRDAMSGGTFVASMGTLDAFCGGILLYLAFTLLLLDFPGDLKQHCREGQPKRLQKKIGLFAALWFGMLLMAAVGNWL